MAMPLDINDLSLHGDRVERHCCDTLIFLCLCNLGSKWRLFSHLCRGRSDNKPKGTTVEVAVSLPKRRRHRIYARDLPLLTRGRSWRSSTTRTCACARTRTRSWQGRLKTRSSGWRRNSRPRPSCNRSWRRRSRRTRKREHDIKAPMKKQLEMLRKPKSLSARWWTC